LAGFIAQGKRKTARVQAHWPQGRFQLFQTTALVKLAKMLLRARNRRRVKMGLLGAGGIRQRPRHLQHSLRKALCPLGTVSPSYVQDQAQARSFLFGIPRAPSSGVGK